MAEYSRIGRNKGGQPPRPAGMTTLRGNKRSRGFQQVQAALTGDTKLPKTNKSKAFSPPVPDCLRTPAKSTPLAQGVHARPVTPSPTWIDGATATTPTPSTSSLSPGALQSDFSSSKDLSQDFERHLGNPFHRALASHVARPMGSLSTPPRSDNGGGSPPVSAARIFHRRVAAPPHLGPPADAAFQGLPNLGNTCYLNSVLQVLSHLSPLVEDLLRRVRHADQSGSPFNSNSVTRALANAFLQRRKAAAGPEVGRARISLPPPSAYAASPASLKQAVECSKFRFAGTQQQDAHEFLCSVLELVEEECRAHTKIPQTFTQGAPVTELEPLHCPVQQNFGSTVQHEFACLQCGHTSKVEEEFTHISVDLPDIVRQPLGEIELNTPGTDPLAPPHLGAGSADVRALLQNFFKSEVVERTCDKCGARECHVAHRLAKLPRVLVVHVKRFQLARVPPSPGESSCPSGSQFPTQAVPSPHTRLAKRRDRVAFPKRLSLQEFCPEPVSATLPLPRPRPTPHASSPSLPMSEKGGAQEEALLLGQEGGESQKWREFGPRPEPASATLVGDTPAEPVLLDEECYGSPPPEAQILPFSNQNRAGLPPTPILATPCGLARKIPPTSSVTPGSRCQARGGNLARALQTPAGQDTDDVVTAYTLNSNLEYPCARAKRRPLASPSPLSPAPRKQSKLNDGRSVPALRAPLRNAAGAWACEDAAIGNGDEDEHCKNDGNNENAMPQEDAEEDTMLQMAIRASMEDQATPVAAVNCTVVEDDDDSDLGVSPVFTEQEQFERAIALSLAECQDPDMHHPTTCVQDSPQLGVGGCPVDQDEDHAPCDAASEALWRGQPAGGEDDASGSHYHLHSVISHLGPHISSGHFIADVHDQKHNFWVRHNDSLITTLTDSQLFCSQMESNIYMLVYEWND